MRPEVDEKCTDLDTANPVYMPCLIRELPYISSCSNEILFSVQEGCFVFYTSLLIIRWRKQ